MFFLLFFLFDFGTLPRIPGLFISGFQNVRLDHGAAVEDMLKASKMGKYTDLVTVTVPTI
jgi:hypothetical protein